PPLHPLLYSFFFSSRRRHTRFSRDWSSDVCSSDLSPPRRSPRAIRHAPGARRRSPPPPSPRSDSPRTSDPAATPWEASASQVLQIGRASCRERVKIAGVGGLREDRRSRLTGAVQHS